MNVLFYVNVTFFAVATPVFSITFTLVVLLHPILYSTSTEGVSAVILPRSVVKLHHHCLPPGSFASFSCFSDTVYMYSGPLSSNGTSSWVWLQLSAAHSKNEITIYWMLLLLNCFHAWFDKLNSTQL